MDVDFTSGIISNGMMTVTASASTTSIWDVTFDGMISGSDVSINNIAGTYTDVFMTITTPIIEATIDGAFAGQPGTNPHFGGVYFFREDVDTVVSGVIAVGGIVDNRLSITQLQAMDQNIGMLYGGTELTLGLASSTTSVPLIGQTLNLLASSFGDTAATHEALTEKITNVIKDNGTGSTVNTVGGFDVGWGIWATGAQSSTDEIEGNFNSVTTDPVYWMSAKAIDKELMPITGSILYNDVRGFQGSSSNDGAFATLTAALTVNFVSGGLTGDIAVTTTDTGILWDIAVTGTINGHDFGNSNGSTAQLNPISGAVHTVGANTAATITGNMSGIFVGTSTPDAFATGFNFSDGVNNIVGNALIGID